MVERVTRPGLHTAVLARDGVRELFITAVPCDGQEGLEVVFRRAVSAVADAGAVIVAQDVFGIPCQRKEGQESLGRVCGDVRWPVTWLEERAGQGERLTGTTLHAVSGTTVEPIRLDGRVVGTVFEDDCARWCRLGDIRPDDPSLSNEEQARYVFEMMERGLASAGMSFSHVLRTWLYIDRILSWYGRFNAVRTAFFKERRVFDGLVPASTGIGGSNAAGTAVIADALAMRSDSGRVKVFPVPSPLQCPALAYGSSFSRAVEVDGGRWRRLLVSGTASISPDGKTVHIGEMEKQVALTMDVVEAILVSRGMSWQDATRAVVYVKHGADAGVFRQYCEQRGLAFLPAVVAENDICRDDLLFEIEVDAAVACG